jgi:hypothetical protein
MITVRIMLPKNADRDLARDVTTLAEAVRAKA